MNKKILVFSLTSLLLLIALTGCVTSKKYKKLETDYQKLQDIYRKANRQLDEKDTQIEELQTMIAEQKMASEREIALVAKTIDEFVASLAKELSSGNIELEQDKNRLRMSIAEEMFFESGKAEIKPEGEVVLMKIAAVLKKIPQKNVRVEGHTDNVRIGPKIREKYPTNWELGAIRAVNVVKFMQEEGGMDPLRLSAVSYGQYRPKATNRTKAGRSKNRRIEIILIDRDLDLAKKMRANLATQ